MKHCSGALSPTINQLASSFIASGQHHAFLTPDHRNSINNDQQQQGNEFRDSARLADAGSSISHPPNSGLIDMTFDKSSSALHAMSNFMLPMVHQPFGGIPSSLLPPGLQSVYSGSNK